MAGRWQHLPHGADIGVRGIGASLAEAFEMAATALTAVTADPAAVAPLVEIEINCVAADQELLLVEWLNAVVYEMATRKMLFARYQVHIEENRLAAKAWGETIDENTQDLGAEVKGATCTNLSVACDGNGQWHAQCIVDV